ncbi:MULTISPECIES: hypothetical protein [unclassified Amycolatopsis]|uniref:hypothetical protein n=1 Tax=unclassified Amycolatopsis TaxID=2618356 RepID=UPI001C696BEE|nr:hypothetical protein [Amycolatopsis sp. DSM 110486]QYN21558.1 hypothetical protein K1T34_03165 [Amycolatopsis sp. DSM 110486]
MKVDQSEVDRFNREGRLHPAQNRQIINIIFWLVVMTFAIGILALATLPYGTTDIIVAAVAIGVGMALCAWYCLYRLNIVRRGKVVTFTGYTHDAQDHRPLPPTDRYPILIYTQRSRGNNPYYWAAFDGLRRPLLPASLYAQIRPDQENTLVLIPNRKQIVNVIPS